MPYPTKTTSARSIENSGSFAPPAAMNSSRYRKETSRPSAARNVHRSGTREVMPTMSNACS